MKANRIISGLVAGVLIAASAQLVHAQTSTDAALDAIDDLVHQWEDATLGAEDALEQIEGIVHDVPASQRTGMLTDIDEVVHHWEDGETSAEEAMEEIAAILHAPQGEPVPAPAASGHGGTREVGTPPALVLGLVAATALLAGGARVARAPNRR